MPAKTEQLQIRLAPREKAALQKRAAAAGQSVSEYVLSRVLPAAGRRFAELVASHSKESEPRYALAELNDLLSTLGAGELREAVARADLGRLSALHRNYVAAMVEHACHQAGIPAPAWAAAVPPLDTPFFAAPLDGLRLHLLRASPVAFKRRNLFVDSTLGDRV